MVCSRLFVLINIIDVSFPLITLFFFIAALIISCDFLNHFARFLYTLPPLARFGMKNMGTKKQTQRAMDFLYIPDATFIIAVEWYRTETIEMLFVSLCQPLMMMMILQIFYWISIQPIEKKNGLGMRTERMFLRASSETKQKSHCITIFFFCVFMQKDQGNWSARNHFWTKRSKNRCHSLISIYVII